MHARPIGRYARPIRRKKKTSGMAIMVFVIMTVISVSAICYVVYHASVAYHSKNASGINLRYWDSNSPVTTLRR